MRLAILAPCAQSCCRQASDSSTSPALEIAPTFTACSFVRSNSQNRRCKICKVADEAMAWLFVKPPFCFFSHVRTQNGSSRRQEHGCESFSDVTVRCDGGSLFLHRNILMSRSEYFKAMFQAETSEADVRGDVSRGRRMETRETRKTRRETGGRKNQTCGTCV